MAVSVLMIKKNGGYSKHCILNHTIKHVSYETGNLDYLGEGTVKTREIKNLFDPSGTGYCEGTKSHMTAASSY